MADRWIVVRNWERFQHPDVGRSDRTPLWIRNYVELLHKDEYLDLTTTQRAVLHGLWLAYAENARKVPENTSKLSRKLNVRVTKRTLEALANAGFIDFLQADCLQSARLEVEVEVEEGFAFTSIEDPDDNQDTKGKPVYNFPIKIDEILKEL